MIRRSFILDPEIYNSIDLSRSYFDEFENTLFIENAVKNLSLILSFDNDRVNSRSVHDVSYLQTLKVNRIVIREYRAIKEVEENTYGELSDLNDDLQFNQSISALLFSALRSYYKYFEVIPYFEISELEDYGFCKSADMVFYDIVIRQDHLSKLIPLLRDIALKRKINIEPFEIILPADKYNVEKYSPKVNFTETLSTSTKARRLGYVKSIIKQFERSTYYPISYFSKIIENQSADLQDQLINYKLYYGGNDKGQISKSFTGISAIPYLKLCEGLNTITTINNAFILTKQSKVYFHFNKMVNVDDQLKDKVEYEYNLFNHRTNASNVFIMNNIDRIFFLKQILIHDTLYTVAILDIINIIGSSFKSSDIISTFKGFVIDEIARALKFASSTGRKELSVIQRRIDAWEKPLKYLQHIVEPRLNWYLDLGIIEQEDNGRTSTYKLSRAGQILNNFLAGISERWFIKFIHVPTFIENNYFYMFSKIYDLPAARINNFVASDIEPFLLDACKIFKTEAPRRIAASQGIEYVCYSMLLYKGRIIEFEHVKQFLLNNGSDKFSLEWYKTENDGALNLKYDATK